MKKYYFFFLLFLSSGVSAQWVSIPDTNFGEWLYSNGYSACMQGNYGGRQLDTTCPTVVGTTNISCYGNNIRDLTGIQYFDSLIALNCTNNRLTFLPPLPNSLTRLLCPYNQLVSLPVLPNSLTNLRCIDNQLISLPALPNNLVTLDCYHNHLVSLPALPSNLFSLDCSYNLLTNLPELPDSMFNCNIGNNPLVCLPQLKRIVNFGLQNTNVTCLPNSGNITNSTPPLNLLPLCDLFNNSGCDVFWNISGKTYRDANLNCNEDNGENSLTSIPVKLRSSGFFLQQTLTVFNGDYTFATDSGSYEITIDTAGLPFYVMCPAGGSYFDTITPLDSLHYNRDFALECKPGFDLAAWSISAPRFLPAGFTTVVIGAGDLSSFYGVHCAAGVSGTVTVTITGAVTFISPDTGALTPIVNGNTLIYNIANFANVNFFTDFNFILQTDTTAPLGSQVCFTVSVTPTTGDNNPANNTLTHCFTVVGSYDPNDKQVYPLNDIDINGERWLTYTINFQNTGTDTAIHIYVTDTLDNDLDVSTFQLLAYSHQPLVQLKENSVRFNFPNIYLVDSNTNEPLSHGYVQYKIKLKDNLPIGTSINNTAFIYFDFNAPVVTNTTTNMISTTITVSDFQTQSLNFKLFPNPANNTINVAVDESIIGGTFTIFDMTGKVIKAIYLTSQYSSFSIEQLDSGLYIAEIKTKNESARKKWTKL